MNEKALLYWWQGYKRSKIKKNVAQKNEKLLIPTLMKEDRRFVHIGKRSLVAGPDLRRNKIDQSGLQ